MNIIKVKPLIGIFWFVLTGFTCLRADTSELILKNFSDANVIVNNRETIGIMGREINGITAEFFFEKPISNWIIKGYVVLSNNTTSTKSFDLPFELIINIRLFDETNHPVTLYFHKIATKDGGIGWGSIKWDGPDIEKIIIQSGQKTKRVFEVYVNWAFYLEKGKTYRMQIGYPYHEMEKWMLGDLEFVYSGEEVVYEDNESPMDRIEKAKALKRKNNKASSEGRGKP